MPHEINDRSENTFAINSALLELRVNNHPGVMSHICGLFARRAFNVEKILCLPIDEGKESRIYLEVNANQSVDQIIKQLLKLEDVSEVNKACDENNVFWRIQTLLKQ